MCGKSTNSNYENNSRGFQLSRLFHVSADYILNGDTPDNLDPVVNEAIETVSNKNAESAKMSIRVLNKLISKKHNGLIKVVTGMRRCGKSYLLFNLYKEYAEFKFSFNHNEICWFYD